MPSGSCIVTLLTDFGTADGYVAAMKGVILSEAPDATVVDAAHDIPHQDVQSASWVLGQYWHDYPEGTVHVAVVDPGVGSARKALVAMADGRYVLAPDNGLLYRVQEAATSFTVRSLHESFHRPGDVSATFHGRDIFSYAAALMANGAATFESISRPASKWVSPQWARAHKEAGLIIGEIIHIDHFGNLITNIRQDDVAGESRESLRITARDHLFGSLHVTYSDVPEGQAVALMGSSGTLEIAIHGGSAATVLGLERGDGVVVARAAK